MGHADEGLVIAGGDRDRLPATPAIAASLWGDGLWDSKGDQRVPTDRRWSYLSLTDYRSGATVFCRMQPADRHGRRWYLRWHCAPGLARGLRRLWLACLRTPGGLAVARWRTGVAIPRCGPSITTNAGTPGRGGRRARGP